MSGSHAIWRGLLVSVRDAAEAVEAVAGGAAIIDVKEPAHGPLGPAAADVAAHIAATVAGMRPWTLACGELCAEAPQVLDGVLRSLSRLPARVAPPAAAKAGPAELDIDAWRRAFEAFMAALPRGIEPVAVAYADWRRAAAPKPAEIIEAAAALGCETVLIDTFDKAGPGLLAAGMEPLTAPWVESARSRGLRVAVAGRLTLGQIPAAASLAADVVAVRSAVCEGGRFGSVRRHLVAAAVRAASGGGRPVFEARDEGPGFLERTAAPLDTISDVVLDESAVPLDRETCVENAGSQGAAPPGA